jgi:uncharacterized membrane protein YeaQ/YmgE (transglycosylase-associated protein family)
MFLETIMLFSVNTLYVVFQLPAYVLCGIIAGQQADVTYRIRRKAGVPASPPAFLPLGAAAGFFLAAILGIIYAVFPQTLMPRFDLAGGSFELSMVLIIVLINPLAGVGLGVIGGILWDRFFS